LSDTTHFGFDTVATAAKAGRVRAVFDSVAGRYDLMNDLMSAGLHRLWKRFAMERTGLRPGQMALDVAAGSGDLTSAMARQVGRDGHVWHTDINRAMLEVGRDRLLDEGIFGNLSHALANAEHLPFRDASFHCIAIGFGLRNVTDKPAALREMARCLKPGGRLLVLEFAKLVVPVLQGLYDQYSFRVLPALGGLVANDEASYRYLAESIRMHPDQAALAGMMRESGLEDPHWFDLSGGIVALHVGYRY